MRTIDYEKSTVIIVNFSGRAGKLLNPAYNVTRSPLFTKIRGLKLNLWANTKPRKRALVISSFLVERFQSGHITSIRLVCFLGLDGLAPLVALIFSAQYPALF